MSTLAILSGALALAITPQTDDLKPADLADLQCMALTAYMVSQVEPETIEQAGIASGVMYYLGRLQGRTPEIDWLPRLQKFSMTLVPEDLQGFAPRCGAELVAIGSAMTAMGETAANAQ
jgi:hypothetical protein